MSIFSKLKSSLMGDSKKPQAGRGHVLGTRETNAAIVSAASSSGSLSGGRAGERLVEVCFEEQSLGMQLHSLDGAPVITKVLPDTEAARKGVAEGDVVVGIDDVSVHSFDQCMQVLRALGRPVSLRFRRPASAQSDSVFSRLVGSSKAPAIAMSAEEREAQRKNLVESAKRREEAWDKKLEKNRNKKKEEVEAKRAGFAFDDANNPETARIVEVAKQRESEAARRLGFSPFKPVMSFSSAGAPSIGEPKQPPPSEEKRSLPAEVTDDLNASVDEALSLMLSLSCAGAEEEAAAAEAVQLAISTALKMLTNLLNNPTDPKLKSIRVNNPNFLSRVSGTPGGKELFVGAGFQVVFEGGEEFLKFPELVSAEDELVLRHVCERLVEFQV